MPTAIFSNELSLSSKELFDIACERQEGIVSQTGALVVQTGKRTGRSPKDRFIVKDLVTESTVDWGEVNQPTTPEVFQSLWKKTNDYLRERTVFVSELQVGADAQYALPVKVLTEYAWHNLFCRHLFIEQRDTSLTMEQEWTLMSAPGLKLDPAIDGVNGDGAVLINFSERKVLLCGMLYAGEMKKAMFSVLNYFLPSRNVLPMHCASNVGETGDVTLFFGLSGTGKTTLSADPKRFLIGDDEHGWSEEGVFNFEGGCYAKCINLSIEREPIIWSAIRDGAIMENVIIDEAGMPDFTDHRLTLNTRAAYPRTHIEKRVIENQSVLPSTVVFLTCDLYGVLPPIALLTKEQAAYYFLSGYTALVGSTEMGSSAGIQPTFSTCFGAPFFPRPATVYADLLMKKVVEDQAQVYLVNTGWTGGAYEEGGQRFSIAVTRKIIDAAISGCLPSSKLDLYPGFDVQIPAQVEGVDEMLLDPRKNWSDQNAYRVKANKLIDLFRGNFKKFTVSQDVVDAGPVEI